MQKWILGLVALPFVGGAALAQSPERFVVDTTADFVALCTTDEADPDYVAAISFCRGYGHGAVHYHQIMAEAVPAFRVFCVPDPAPSRAEVWQGFLGWIDENPEYMSDEALDALFAFLESEYPCA